MNTPDYDAEPLDEFIDALRRDPDAPAPAWLTSDFAEFLRRVVRSEQEVTMDKHTQARIWQQVVANRRAGFPPPALPRSPNGSGHNPVIIPHKAHRTAELRGALTGLAAALILFVLGAWLLFGQRNGQAGGKIAESGESSPTPTPAGAATSATEPAVSPVLAPSQPSANVAWSPRGDLIASVGGAKAEEVLLWDGKAQLLKSLKGHSGAISGLAWSPDGNVLASGGSDNSIRLWTPAGDPIAILSDHTGRVDSLMWSPDGRLLASAASQNDGTIRLWTAQGQPVLTIKGGPTGSDNGTRILWSPDGKRLLARYGDSTADVWSSDGTLMASLDTQQYDAEDITWSPDSSWIAVTTFNQGVRIYNAGGKLETTLSDMTLSTMVRWSPDGRFLAVSRADAAVKLYDMQRREVIASIDNTGGNMTDMAFSPDGRVLATATANSLPMVQIWDLRGQSFASYQSSQTVLGEATARWSPDGKAIAVWTKENATSALQVLTVDSKLLAGAVVPTVASVTSPQPAAATLQPTPDATPSDGNNVEYPLQFGQAVIGTIAEPNQTMTYVGDTSGEESLLVLLQSDDFAVNLSSRIRCAAGGGGGGGGGSNARGGNSHIRPYVFQTCKGQIRLVVGSDSGTEAGNFTMSVYPLPPNLVTAGTPITDMISADVPFKHYTIASSVGDMLTAQLDNQAGAALQLLVDGYYMPGSGGSNTRIQRILGGGNYDVLVLPDVKGAVGRFSLTLKQEHPPVLGSSNQSAFLDADHSVAAFKLEGSDKPTVLKVKITAGARNADVMIIPALPSRSAPGIATLYDQTVRFAVAQGVPMSFKLSALPDSGYVAIISSTDGATMTVELSLATP